MNTSVIRSLASQSCTRVTLVEGDGIGPDICRSVQKIFKTFKVPVQWDIVPILPASKDDEGAEGLSKRFIESTLRNKVALKGPLATPVGFGHRSLNLRIRKALNLYTNLRPCYSMKGVDTTYKNVNLVTVRENTEGEYCGIEHAISPGMCISSKIITKTCSERQAHFAFGYAQKHGRSKVTILHNSIMLPITDGLFVRSCRRVADLHYKDVACEDMELDRACMLLASDPSQFDVMLMPNLYGDIVSDLCAGMVGGLGLASSGNIGDEVAVFEAVHGSAPKLAGQNIANPTALLLSSLMMLRHVGLHGFADRISEAVITVFGQHKSRLTHDLGGSAGTDEYTQSICEFSN